MTHDPNLTFDEYQQHAYSTDTMCNPDRNGRGDLVYPTLGLAGETGEVVDKVKKLWRNKQITDGELLSQEDKIALMLELGDVLWYFAALCTRMGVPMSSVASLNQQKLDDRRSRGVIRSEGDNR